MVALGAKEMHTCIMCMHFQMYCTCTLTRSYSWQNRPNIQQYQSCMAALRPCVPSCNLESVVSCKCTDSRRSFCFNEEQKDIAYSVTAHCAGSCIWGFNVSCDTCGAKIYQSICTCHSQELQHTSVQSTPQSIISTLHPNYALSRNFTALMHAVNFMHTELANGA